MLTEEQRKISYRNKIKDIVIDQTKLKSVYGEDIEQLFKANSGGSVIQISMDKFNKIYGGGDEEEKNPFAAQVTRKPFAHNQICNEKRFDNIDLMPDILTKTKNPCVNIAFDKQVGRDCSKNDFFVQPQKCLIAPGFYEAKFGMT